MIGGTCGERPMWASEFFLFLFEKKKKYDGFPSPGFEGSHDELNHQAGFFAAIDKRNVSQWNGNCVFVYIGYVHTIRV